MFDPDTDTYAYWFGYMFATVKKTAGNGDALSINSLREFCDHSRFALDTDREVLEQAVSNPRDLAQKSAGLEAQDAQFSRRVPDTPGLRLAGVFECEPDPSCGARDGAA